MTKKEAATLAQDSIIVDLDKFVGAAKDFFGERPSERNGLPTASLLLFHEPRTDYYGWILLANRYAIADCVNDAVLQKFLIPIGAAHLVFEQREMGRFHLSNETDGFTDTGFDMEEVFNCTIPYFLRDTLNPDLVPESIKFSDLSKN